MAGYTRNDTSNNIADGNVINATDLDGEYNAIEAAFNESTGHSHDGTSAEGAPITKVGPVQDVEVSATAVTPKSASASNIDLGASGVQFKDLYIDGLAYIDGLGENLLVNSTNSIQFRDSALAINSSADGQLDIIADTELEITTPTVELNTDGQVLAFGADGDVTLTHVADTALQLNTTSSLQFRDSALGINSSADGQLDIYADTQLEITVPTVELNTDGQILAFGADGDVTLTHVADTALLLNGGIALRFRDSALSINSSSDGQLDIDADTELELTAPTVDINASTSVNISNDLNLDSDSAVLSFGTDSEVTLTHVHNIGTELKVVNATTNSVTDVLDLQVESSGTPANGIGSGLTFSTETASGNVEIGGAIRSITTGLTPTDEEIDLVFYSMRDGSLTEGFRYDSSADTLDVTGGITATGDVSIADKIVHTGDTNTAIRFPSADTVTVETAGTERLRIDSSGIDVTGTVTADGLAVSGASTPTFKVTNTTAGSTGSPQYTELLFEGYNNEDRATIKVADTALSGNFGFLEIHTQNTSNVVTRRLNINSGGDISFYEDTGTTPLFFWDASAESLGIGTTSPSQNLHVAGNTLFATSSGSIESGFTSGGSNAYALLFAQSTSGTLYMGVNGTAAGSAVDVTGILDNASYFGSRTNHATQFLTNNTVRATIDSSGNLGIGTTSPGTMLDVAGNARVRGSATPTLTFNDGAIENTLSITSSSFVLSVPSANPITFHTTNTERMRIDSSGNLDLTAGGGDIIMANGAGIDFSASAGGGASSSILDDYEEGTWTPVLSDGTNNATMGANNGGKYTKVGNCVTFSAQITVSTIDSVGANARITGLPFTNANDTAARSGVAVGYGDSLAITAGRVVTGYVALNEAFIELQYWDAATGTTGLDGSEISNGGVLLLSSHIYVA